MGPNVLLPASFLSPLHGIPDEDAGPAAMPASSAFSMRAGPDEAAAAVPAPASSTASANVACAAMGDVHPPPRAHIKPLSAAAAIADFGLTNPSRQV